VSPNKIINYLSGIIIGFLLPFITVYTRNLLDTKIHEANDLKDLKIPLLGEIPLTRKKKRFDSFENDSSNKAEAFRYIRTNVNFLLEDKTEGKTIFVTSTKSGEGKTFTAINLAQSLAVTGKKTLLVGMDLRNPKLGSYLEISDGLGVTNFLINKNLRMEDIIEEIPSIENLNLIRSGDIPPNPVEILMNPRIKDIFDYSKNNYDYVIVDTAPVGLVIDMMQIRQFADMSLYVIKANYIDKRMLNIPISLFEDNKLPGMQLVINGTGNSGNSYGYGYGYGEANKKKWYERIF